MAFRKAKRGDLRMTLLVKNIMPDDIEFQDAIQKIRDVAKLDCVCVENSVRIKRDE